MNAIQQMFEATLLATGAIIFAVGFWLGKFAENKRWRARCKRALAAAEAAREAKHKSHKALAEAMRNFRGRFANVDASRLPAKRSFVIIVKSDGVDDYIQSAAHGYNVSKDDIRECLRDYCLNDRFTLVFDLNGRRPYILPNTEKGTCQKNMNETTPSTTDSKT